MNVINKKYNKYLPSKKFILIAITCLASVLFIFVIFFMQSGGENFIKGSGSKKSTALTVENQSVTNLMQQDSNGDGIPDWEKVLWGLDPNKTTTPDGTPYPVYIANKQKELEAQQGASTDEQNLTETDQFAREFFASYASMQSSGQVDSNTIDSFSNALGQKIVNPQLIDRYSTTDLQIGTSDDQTARQNYYTDIKKLFETYKSAGMGEELSIISSELTSNSTNGTVNNTSQNNELSTIATAYQNFAEKIIKTSAPQSLSQYGLAIANSANNTGVSVSNMEKITSDPIVGLSGISQYEKYSNDLVTAVGNLNTALSEQ
jgi:hypothetical protein